MRKANRLLAEMFLSELTPMKHAETELNMGQSVAKPQPVKKEAGEAGSGLRVSGDPATLGALLSVFSDAAHNHGGDTDDDILDWVDDCVRALKSGAKSGSVTLPAYQATPDLDSFNDDAGSGGEEEI